MRRNYCEICGRFGFIDQHHIHAKCKGGSNAMFNVIDVCPNCHREIHAGEIIVHGKQLTSNGWKIICTDNSLVETNQLQYIF